MRTFVAVSSAWVLLLAVASAQTEKTCDCACEEKEGVVQRLVSFDETAGTPVCEDVSVKNTQCTCFVGGPQECSVTEKVNACSGMDMIVVKPLAQTPKPTPLPCLPENAKWKMAINGTVESCIEPVMSSAELNDALGYKNGALYGEQAHGMLLAGAVVRAIYSEIDNATSICVLFGADDVIRSQKRAAKQFWTNYEVAYSNPLNFTAIEGENHDTHTWINATSLSGTHTWGNKFSDHFCVGPVTLDDGSFYLELTDMISMNAVAFNTRDPSDPSLAIEVGRWTFDQHDMYPGVSGDVFSTWDGLTISKKDYPQAVSITMQPSCEC